LKLSAAAGGAALLAACTPTTATPSASPNTSAGATAVPSGVPGGLAKLEGPTIVTDASRFPKTLKEAPELAALVQQGKLPPVAQRVGQDPIVIQPAHEVGKYGGTLNKVWFGPSDMPLGRFFTGPTGLLLWDYEWKTVRPHLARSYTVSPDNKTFTVQLRRGMKWSDGAPLTADDIVFWFEDLYGNEELSPGPNELISIGGKSVTARKVDDMTVEFIAPAPFPLFLETLATPVSALYFGPIRMWPAPKHYLSKFHAKYVGKAEADRLAAAAGHPGWAAHLLQKVRFQGNTELPVLFPWVLKNTMSDPNVLVLERNPYSIWVDTDGNQLPYIGTVRHTRVESPDIMLLKTTAGEIDFGELVYTVPQLPVLIQNQDKGKYKVYRDPEQAGVGIFLNLSYEADPVIGDLLRNVDFRRALSMGIDRNQLNETFWLGTGTPSSAVPTRDNRYYPGDEWRTKWATLDLAQANQLLDKIGLTQKDSDGFRLRRDGKRLALQFMTFEEAIDMAQFAEMVKTQWKKIGVDLTLDPVSVDLMVERTEQNSAQVTFSNAITDDPFFGSGSQAPVSHAPGQILGVLHEEWWKSGGAKGKEPPADVKQAIALWSKLGTAATIEERIKVGQDLAKFAVDNVMTIGVVSGSLSFGIRIAKTNLGNVPARFPNSHILLTPVTAMAQTYYFK
jgi:peptide/nickel transport system substrate-binding protein